MPVHDSTVLEAHEVAAVTWQPAVLPYYVSYSWRVSRFQNFGTPSLDLAWKTNEYDELGISVICKCSQFVSKVGDFALDIDGVTVTEPCKFTQPRSRSHGSDMTVLSSERAVWASTSWPGLEDCATHSYYGAHRTWQCQQVSPRAVEIVDCGDASSTVSTATIPVNA